jgi:hypothetical protein
MISLSKQYLRGLSRPSSSTVIEIKLSFALLLPAAALLLIGRSSLPHSDLSKPSFYTRITYTREPLNKVEWAAPP